MIIGTCKVYMRADWVNTLKEKRMVVKSIVEKTRNKFNISIAEVELMDSHRDMGIGFACVTNERSHADSIIGNVLNFIENNTEAEVVNIVTEIL